VKGFGLFRTPRILFGAGEARQLPILLKPVATRVLFLTGSKSHRENPELIRLFSTLEKEGLEAYFDRIGNEPGPADVDRITDRFRNADIQAVVAIGGGSVLDTGKAVSAMLPLEGGVQDYLEGVGTRRHPGMKKFFAALPTTSGTGSEATANAVLSGRGPQGGFKRSLRHENLVPDIALVDPQLTLGCPPTVTAASGLDALTQLMESYLSVKSGSLTDALAFDGIRRIHRCLLPAFRDGSDLEARSGMSYAALISGITLANAGLGLVHGFASSVGAVCDVPHGVVCGTLMATVNKYNIRKIIRDEPENPASEKYAALGRLFSDKEGKSRYWYMMAAMSYLEELTETLSVPRLGGYGLQIGQLGAVAAATDNKANPLKFEAGELETMLLERL
jgi:alcohol dehydrogenase class IV